MAPPAVPVLTVTPLPAYGLVRLACTFGATTDELDIHRTGPSGTRAYVRSVAQRDVGGTTALDIDDLEAPEGVELDYVAVARNEDGETPSVTHTVELELDDDWLVDIDSAANTGPVNVESLAELDYDVPQGIHRIIGRRTPIVTQGLRYAPGGQLVLVTLDVEEARRVRDALASSSPLLLRTLLEHGVGNLYMTVRTFKEQRPSPLATAPERRWVVDFVEIDRPDPDVFDPVFVSYADAAATWATYAAMAAARPDYGALLVDRTGIAGVAGYTAEPGFPPRDV